MIPETFNSQGHSYVLNTFPCPADGKRYPLVVLLHGNGGLIAPYGDQIKGFARDLSHLGYFAAVPTYYLDTVPHFSDTNPHDQVLDDAITELSRRYPQVDASRIALIGYSLGAATCMTLIASKASGTISAFVDYFGFLTPTIRAATRAFPPSIIFHNNDDRIVDVSNSEDLDKSLTAASVTHDFVRYTESWLDVNHAFKPNGTADVNSRKLATDWIVKYLPPTGL